MNDIKELLIKILEESPEIAIWVLVILYGYKVAIAGTIYGLIRYAIRRICETLEYNRNAKLREMEEANRKPSEWSYGDSILIKDAKENLQSLLDRMRRDRSTFSPYIHSSDIRKLEEAYEEIRAKANKAT